jgi:GT2 family glycosyltransferase
MRFWAIIVNYNNQEETLQAVKHLQRSAAAESNAELLVTVVDNSDRDFFNATGAFDVVSADGNIGLSPAWCLAFDQRPEADPDYVIFLNNDAVVSDDFFAQLEKGIKKWGRDCAFGPRIYYRDQPDLVWSRGGEISPLAVSVKHFGEGVHKDTLEPGDFETGHLSGCCMIVPYRQLNDIGGPDPNFFFRGEEWDLNYRLGRAGVRLVILDEMSVWHTINASHDRFSADMLYLAYRAKVLFVRKHHPFWWFPIWWMAGLTYSALFAHIKFARLAKGSTSGITSALVAAFWDGLCHKKILPRRARLKTEET